MLGIEIYDSVPEHFMLFMSNQSRNFYIVYKMKDATLQSRKEELMFYNLLYIPQDNQRL